MKKLLFFSFLAGTLSYAQTMTLNLIHEYNGEPFALNTVFETPEGVAVEFTRVQYYISNFTITHDGSMSHIPTDSYVLASGNISSYSFDVETTITNVEAVDFKLGVDATANGQGTSFWPDGHPLATQVPNMDWGWPSGYKFWAIEGKIDNNGDGVPNDLFQLHGIGNSLLRDVNVSGLSGSEITMYVNVGGWLNGMDLDAAGIQHNGDTENTQVANNTVPQNVFTAMSTASNGHQPLQESKLYADCTMEYAPTIYYDLLTNDLVNVVVHDLSGKEVLKTENLNPEGNYFIRKELPTGTYVATFYNDGLRETIKFVVRK